MIGRNEPLQTLLPIAASCPIMLPRKPRDRARPLLAWCVFGFAAMLMAGCGEAKAPASSNEPGPICGNCTPTGQMTYALPSPPGAILWTATNMDKVLREAAPPTAVGDGIALFAAKNEFEPFQIVVRADSAASATLQMSAFSGPSGSIIDRIELRRVGYVKISEPSDASSIPSGQLPDPLEPSSFGASESLPAGANQPFWVTVYVPPSATAGDYQATLSVTVGGAQQDVAVSLHVFDFTLPARPSVDGSWNTSFQALGGGASLEAVEGLKTFFFEHRLVPAGVAWPAGLNYNGGVDYDCASGSFLAQDNPYDFSQLGPKYVEGQGWNGAGFGSLQVMRFVDNTTPRPAQFCGVDRGPDHYGTDAYNTEWKKLLKALNDYLVARGWEDLAHYYVQNEPQNEQDYALAAFLANLSKSAAPSLRIAISEEPKAEIAEHASAQGHSYDLWWANLSHFAPGYAATRQAAGEQLWWYFLYGDQPPFFNPITIDHPGIESRICHWAAFLYRVKGLAYYSVTAWGSDPYNDPRPQGTKQNGDGFLLYPPADGALVSSIRFELLREGAEDYEYLRLANGSTVPATPMQSATCDSSAQSAVSSPTSFTRDASALQHLRNQLGTFIEGGVDGCPVLDSTPPGAHARGAYYLNFQDPAGQPAEEPLVADGHEWIKLGWSAYVADKGYGWSGPYIGDDNIMLHEYLSDAPVNELQRSIIYNDYGRTDTFNWDIENGRYEVAVSIGWHDRSYDSHRVVVEAQLLFDSVATTPQTPYRVASTEVTVGDGNLTVEIGQHDAYTMLNWISIEPVD